MKMRQFTLSSMQEYFTSSYRGRLWCVEFSFYRVGGFEDQEERRFDSATLTGWRQLQRSAVTVGSAAVEAVGGEAPYCGGAPPLTLTVSATFHHFKPSRGCCFAPTKLHFPPILSSAASCLMCSKWKRLLMTFWWFTIIQPIDFSEMS